MPGAALPGLVRLPGLLGLDEMTPEAIRTSWAAATGVSTPVGVGEHGAFSLDLVRDGPHGLVGGTTGSGKSEFLRSLVAGLAARNDPTRLTFILIDFKGGAAFATCERLPHTIGTVSNLDAQLADRALRALEAEMDYRQRVFAAAGEGIDNLDAYLATKPAEPMPRLLLVVDEFAMLAKEYPDVLSSLVSVAAVGRTLGVHMILATQRPAGVVNEDILANTNLRVALRVQSRDDSINVVGVPTAAAIGRSQMGRAFVKLGQDDITPVQTALVTGRSEAQSSMLVDVLPVAFGQDGQRRTSGPVDDDAPADLDLLIDAIVAANDEAGYAPPRPVWPEPLGERVELAATADPATADPRAVGRVAGMSVQVALADDPDGQRQLPAGWDLDRGNLLLMGIPGSGTSTTLASLALTLASDWRPEDLDLLVLDLGSRDLAPLANLPHTAAYVGSGAASREQQVRLLKFVRAELDRRRATPGPHRRTVVLIDGLAALKDEYDDFEGIKLLEGLYRAYSDGPEVGLWCAATTTRAKAVPSAMDEVTTQKWLFRLADQYDYAAAGVPAEVRAGGRRRPLRGGRDTVAGPRRDAVDLARRGRGAGRGPVGSGAAEGDRRRPAAGVGERGRPRRGRAGRRRPVAHPGGRARVRPGAGGAGELRGGARPHRRPPALGQVDAADGARRDAAGRRRGRRRAADGLGRVRATFAAGGRRSRPVCRGRRGAGRTARHGARAVRAAGAPGRRRRAARRRRPGHRRAAGRADHRSQGGGGGPVRRPALPLQPLDQDGAQVPCGRAAPAQRGLRR